MLAELVDAVVGVDTHRDTHEVEIALPSGAPIRTRKINNDSSGFAELLAWIGDHSPGPRVVVSIEGTRSFGVGLARAVAAAGLVAESGIPVDGWLVESAALLHDIDKPIVRRTGGEHGVVGARQLEEAGHEELAMGAIATGGGSTSGDFWQKPRWQGAAR